MFARYRSYTSYSEENGKLVPSKEPLETDIKFEMNEKLVLVKGDINKTIFEEDDEKKLKSEADKKESSAAK
jgi:hypothetical protein